MQQQISCPNCQTPYMAEVTQIVDVGAQPILKQMLLSGRLNVAVCPNCNAGIQLAAPLLYHDPAHELFMAYVPMELNLPHLEQEKLIGEMVRQVMDKLPAEERRAYMLQPLTIIKFETLIEKVLETEGVTPEMLERQKKQATLLQDFARADKDVADHLIAENSGMLDAAFIAMLESALQQLLQTNEEQQILRLTNLQARLYRETEAGRQLQKQKIALHHFQKEAKEQGGLSPALLIKHIIANEGDDEIVGAIGQMAQSGLTYHFFQEFSSEIEKRARQGDVEGVRRLEAHRKTLLETQEQAQEATKATLEAAAHNLQMLLNAPDMRQAIQENLGGINEAMMFVLNNTLAQAEEIGNKEQADKLRQAQQIIAEEMEKQMPPELALINKLATLESETEQRQFLDDNPEMVRDEMAALLKELQNQSQAGGDPEFADRMGKLAGIIEARLAIKN